MLTVAVLGTACSAGGSSATPDVRSQDRDVAFTSCADTRCDGDIDGAAFQILMPEQWNGTLLLWSHGIRAPHPLPTSPDTPVRTAPEPAPGWTSQAAGPVAEQLLAQGFALAGSAYRSNGWAVADAVADQTALYHYFVDHVGRPDRTVVWGASLGGLVAALLEEQQPDWVDGAAPMCGVLAGGVDNLDLGLDVTYGLKQLLEPRLRLTGYRSWGEAVRQWRLGYDAVVAAGSDLAQGVPAIVLLAALVDAPKQTATYDGSTLESQVRAYGEGLVNALTYSTLFRSDIEQRAGGNPSSNLGVDYAARVSPDERALVDAIGGPGTTDRLLGRLARGHRVAADPDARAELTATSTPVGTVTDPVLTIHTAADPLVIAQNESVYSQRAAASPDRTADLVAAFTVAPAQFPSSKGAPYGAGHCNFTPGTFIGVAELMDTWVRDGVMPAAATIEQQLGPSSGYQASYRPGPWPAEPRS